MAAAALDAPRGGGPAAGCGEAPSAPFEPPPRAGAAAPAAAPAEARAAAAPAEALPDGPEASPEAAPASPGGGFASPHGGSPRKPPGDEGVFEIRDFTTASSFERLSHRMSMAAKKWEETLRAAAGIQQGPVPVEGQDRAEMLEEFEHNDFRYQLLFQLFSPTGVAAQDGQPAGVEAVPSAPQDRLGLHTFPSRAHSLQRWFGVRHFVTAGVHEQNFDPDSARTVLSALVLALQHVSSPFALPLSCFVPIEDGTGRGRRRYLGELLHGGCRTIYTTDQKDRADTSLEHLEGLVGFFHQKFGFNSAGPSPALSVGARFTYFADCFPAGSEGGTAFSPAGPSAASDATPIAASEEDAVESVQLHCLWPSFPYGSFVDKAGFSELDPHDAAFWKIRVMHSRDTPLPRTRLLRNLLDFRDEARAVLSAEQSAQPKMATTALASLTSTIQEHLEYILLPTPAEMRCMSSECLDLPIVTGRPPDLDGPHGAALAARLAPLRGVGRGTRLAKLAELGAGMRCFKGAVMLWCDVVATMRRQWDGLEPFTPAYPPPSPATRRAPARGVRAELFGAAACLAQQKLEMFQRSVEGRGTSPVLPASSAVQLVSEGSGQALVPPELQRPALLTEDMVVRLDTAAASMTDPTERAELHGRELRSDMAAFKAANHGAILEDFVAWRTDAERLSLDAFPLDWLRAVFLEVEPRPAGEQQDAVLFRPEQEAEMALHYLENIDGTQLLLQLLRALLRVTLEELSHCASPGGPEALRALHDRAVEAALAAFCPATRSGDAHSPFGGDGEEEQTEVDATFAPNVQEAEEFPSEEFLKAAVAAVEALEGKASLADSLRAKLPGPPGEQLLQDLLANGEAVITTQQQRKSVEGLFADSRALARRLGREAADGRGVFESPLTKEFVLLQQPAGGATQDAHSAAPVGARRLYAELRQRHVRLALVCPLRVA